MPERRQFGLFRNRRYIKGRYPLKDQKDIVQELEYYRGDTIRFELQVFDECDETYDITDHDITITVRCEEWSPDILFQATLAGDPDVVELINAPEGVVQFTLPPTFTELLEPRGYIFDVELIRQSDGFVQTVIREVFNIKRDITVAEP